MNDIRISQFILDKLPSAIHRGVFISLLEEADENGRLTISVREFAKRVCLSYQTTRTILKYLYVNAIINADANAKLTQRLTQIIICNYESYIVSARKSQRKANATTNATTNAEVKEKTAQISTHPTLNEIGQYILEKGYNIDPERFFAYYESNGWMIGKSKMKNWKAALLTWNKNNYGCKRTTNAEYDPRRGVDAGIHKASDYGGPF